ncbi:MAG: HEAT repeat domain-containing protein [Acidobacteriota bacterium]
MKKKILLFLAAVLLLACTASAQDPEQLRKMNELQERGQKITEAYDAIANTSPSLKVLNERGERSQMVIEAAKTGDRALIPHLRVLADDKGPAAILSSNKTLPRSLIGTDSYLAHIALAKLGDPSVLPEVLAELEGADDMAQEAAVAKLGQIGGKEAYQKLFQLLDDTSTRPHAIDNPLRPKSQQAMGVLSQLFSDSPQMPNGMTNYDPAAWKTWAARNKHLIE